jgi:transcription-repair coupling factor (superfamily II helicase)
VRRDAGAGHHRAGAHGAAVFLAAYTFFFQQGESLDEAQLKSQLTLAGYTHVTQVMSPGEYSVRGGLIDLFPMGSALPYRLDLFGDTIETIRTFDADTQRSLYPVQEVRCCRAASSRWTKPRAPPSAAAGASISKATRRAP